VDQLCDQQQHIKDIVNRKNHHQNDYCITMHQPLIEWSHTWTSSYENCCYILQDIIIVGSLLKIVYMFIVYDMGRQALHALFIC